MKKLKYILLLSSLLIIHIFIMCKANGYQINYIKDWAKDRGLVIKNISKQATCIYSPFYDNNDNLIYKVTVLTKPKNNIEVYWFRQTIFGFDIKKF